MIYKRICLRATLLYRVAQKFSSDRFTSCIFQIRLVFYRQEQEQNHR